MKTTGKQIISDFWNCPKDLLKDKTKILEIMKKAAKESKINFLGQKSFQFKNFAVGALLLSKQSYISCLIYPECQFVGIEIYVRETKADLKKTLDHLKKELKPGKVKTWTINRGII